MADIPDAFHIPEGHVAGIAADVPAAAEEIDGHHEALPRGPLGCR